MASGYSDHSNVNSVVDVNTVGSFCMLIISAIVITILSFTQKRVKLGLDTCNGVPGIVPPVNFLNPRHRLVYVLMFGVIGSHLAGLPVSSYSLTASPWADSFVQYIYVTFAVLVLVVYTYPLFACVEAPIPVVGYFLGALYSLLYFVYIIITNSLALRDISKLIVTKKFKNILYANVVVAEIPQICCLLAVIIWYFYKLVKELMRKSQQGGGWTDTQASVHLREYYSYVEQLWHKNNNDQEKGFPRAAFSTVRLPLPVMIAAVVAAIIIFQFTVLTCFFFPFVFELVGNLVGAANATKTSKVLDTVAGISVIAPIASCILSCVLFGHFIYTLRRNMVEIKRYQRELSMKPIKWPALTLGSSVRYAGYQAAAIVTAWIVHTVVIFVILILIMLLFAYPSFVGVLYFRLAVTVGWLLLILGGQILICKLFFITRDSPELGTVILDNRRVFNLFSYMIFLYNVLTGIMTAIVRVAVSLLFMMLILPRMDRILYVRGFEVFDLGHGMFKNFMIMESILHNPIVNVFVALVSKDGQLLRFNSGSPLLSSQGKNTPPQRRKPYNLKAVNRWLVAYTLIKNPSLIELRRSSFQPKYEDNLPGDGTNPLFAAINNND